MDNEYVYYNKLIPKEPIFVDEIEASGNLFFAVYKVSRSVK